MRPVLARTDEVFPLICPKSGGAMRINIFIDECEANREIFLNQGERTIRPKRAPTHDPLLWGAVAEGGTDPPTQPIPEFEFDQR